MANTARYMEHLGLYLLQGGANVFTAGEILTPVGRDQNLAMLIHYTEVLPDWTETGPAIGAPISVHAFISDREFAADQPESSVGVIHGVQLENEAEPAPAAGTTFSHQRGEFVKRYSPALLYAKSYIWVHINGVNCVGAHAVRVKIGYTLEQVSQQAFIAALVD